MLLILIPAVAVLVWGWMLWSIQPKPHGVVPLLSFSGSILATASALLAIMTAVVAQFHRFPYWDPTLIKIFAVGVLLSLEGMLFGVVGIWRPSSVRWHSPVCALATLAFWIMAASGE